MASVLIQLEVAKSKLLILAGLLWDPHESSNRFSSCKNRFKETLRKIRLWSVPNRQCLIDSVYPLDPIDSI